MLELRKITKSYENQLLLNNISLQVTEGKTLCLLGASGSGKSTLLRIIAGLESAETGSVLWNGLEINQTPTHLRHFGLMFQDYALFPHLNVWDNVAFGLRMQGKTESQIKVRTDEVLRLVNMGSFSRRRVADLSGGEQQRVALARTLAPSPRLIMLDEPMAALDRTLRTQLTAELREILRSTGIPAIYVTHDQQEAFAIGDRLALIQSGSIVQSGIPEEVYHFPANPEVAKFFGLTNLVDGTIQQVKPLVVKTEVGLFSLREQPGTNWNIGEQVTLLLRPTSARIITSADSVRENQIKGTAVSCVFQEAGYVVRMKPAASIVEFQFELDSPIEPGSEISLILDGEQIHCYAK